MSQYYDLSGVLQVQRNAIIDISNVYKGSTESVSSELSTLQTHLNNIQAGYVAANSAVGATLTEQEAVKSIVNNEKDRLDAKKNDIENKLEYTRRMLSLNDSATKRKRDYMKIVVILVVLLVVYIIIVKFTQAGILPSGISEFLIILLIGCGAIYIFILWRAINVRNNMDHDKLNIPSPNTLSPEELAKLREQAAASGSLTGASYDPNACSGQICCSVGTTWENGVNRCIKPPSAADKVILVDISNVIINGNTYNSGDEIPRISCIAPNYKICGNACISSSATCRTEGFTANVPDEFVSYSLYVSPK